MPSVIPPLPADFIANIGQLTLPEIAYEVASALLDDAIPSDALKAIINDAVNFDAPARRLDKNTYVLELFHGPSLAFKDFGARFMSRVMAYFLKDDDQLLDILVATSGDTGGAVALGFLAVPRTRVTILYPKGKVSEIQELQLCTNGQNIHALEVNGTFDDCQRLVKQAFSDEALNAKLRLTSANSINIARLIPQTFYYFWAYAQLKKQGKEAVVFAVPSGNFGNLAAGLIAHQMGLPVKQFIAATNANDTVPRYLETGVYEARPAVSTYANAMDVGAPSNWVRIMDLFKQDRSELLKRVKGYTFSDEETLEAIEALYEKYGYVACPHTAIAWRALKSYQEASPADTFAGAFLSTAHPCKFPDVFPANIAAGIAQPPQVEELRSKVKQVVAIEADFKDFKAYLLGL